MSASDAPGHQKRALGLVCGGARPDWRQQPEVRTEKQKGRRSDVLAGFVAFDFQVLSFQFRLRSFSACQEMYSRNSL